jgi:hypothetical protein
MYIHCTNIMIMIRLRSSNHTHGGLQDWDLKVAITHAITQTHKRRSLKVLLLPHLFCDLKERNATIVPQCTTICFSFPLPITYPLTSQSIFQNAPSLNGNNPSDVIKQGTHENITCQRQKKASPPLWDLNVIMQLVSAVVVSSKHQIPRVCEKKDRGAIETLGDMERLLDIASQNRIVGAESSVAIRRCATVGLAVHARIWVTCLAEGLVDLIAEA